jgi:hypothetical protein
MTTNDQTLGEMDPAQAAVNEDAQHIRDYLRGYGRNNHDALKRLAECEYWQEMAELELKRRTSRFLQNLSDRELLNVATLKIDFSGLALGVLDELQGEQA